jgi:putative spermidine/putrescine transport system permease protein
MAAIAGVAPEQAAAPAPRRAARGRQRPQFWRWAVLILVGIYFAVPLYAAFKFAGAKAFPQVFSQAGFGAAFALSIRLAVITTVITLLLLVPTTVYVHLRLPGIRRLMESITILPIVIPPIVLIVGVLEIAPGFLKASPNLLGLEYVVLAMPFAYRSLDAGLRALDLKTLVEASGSLGARMHVTLWRVILPNLRTAMLSAVVLTVALVSSRWPAWTFTRPSRSGS